MAIKTTHVGSLVRPDELVAYLRKRDAGEAYDEDAYAECLRRSVHEVVQKQKDAGIDIVSDGEYGKSAWNYYVYERLSGIELRPHPVEHADFAAVNTGPTDWARFPEFYADYFANEQEYEGPGGEWAAVEKVTYAGQAVIERDIANLKAAMEAAGVEEGFLPVVAPASAFPELIDDHYGSEEAALMGIAEALREEYKAIVDAGLYVQIDDAYIPFMYDVIVPPGTMDDYRAWAQPRIDAVNHALEGIPADRVRYHVCWGSWNGPHTNDISLKDVLELVFQVNAGTYLYEHANPRHAHEWKLWEDVALPAGKTLAPGVISHATNVVEHPQLVAQRLEQTARLVGAEHVLASTDCGFAQGPYIHRVHESIQWAKLSSLAEGAKLASRALV
ncbi:cobalamin-independent methionine synthase II family protein [Solirubrobacter phytolaccae]|uniref:Cobalamin-independent methionine synthase II family protein n=1 Tax=Solirubrobacter phytolaccae TaxID=1404360 RepID=A0A9X3NH63_9ACTN|nr:cobalamin-independent methionine synthase II family protein [Solirubrobacter phytolaccae]MDA0185304.1 cobalamin-independent methionine synthase II family protein [Solirubrobacter phytolaccae]